MNQSKFGHFLTGAIVGVGLGILLAPQEGEKTRKELQSSFKAFVDSLKNIDVEETKALFIDRVKELQDELSSISPKEAVENIEDKIVLITKKCDELIQEAKDNSLPFVEKSVIDVKEKTVNFLEELQNKIKKEINNEKKKKKNKK